MTRDEFHLRKKNILDHYEQLLQRKNEPVPEAHGLYCRYTDPVLTAGHVPPAWIYDFCYEDNPRFLSRLGINAVFNPGAIHLHGLFYLAARVEGWDRKSFFALAQSPTGVDQFRFLEEPVEITPLDENETNYYDLRLVQHEDGWIYGQFCVESKDPAAPRGDTSMAVAQAGLVRTRDLRHWERLANLKTPSPQQRNVVLHPEFIDGKYAFYTRPQDGFIETGRGGGIGWGLARSMEHPELAVETIVDEKRYHTIKEVKNGQGPAPIKTGPGWLHLAHGVRNTAAGLRYVLYLFMTSLEEPWRVIYLPGGYFMAPQGPERIGDVSNVLFSNGWILDDKGKVFIYYASSDTRTHVATAPLATLVDYVMHTPPDPGHSAGCVRQRLDLIRKNLKHLHD